MLEVRTIQSEDDYIGELQDVSSDQSAYEYNSDDDAITIED
jgi:hypothetical protein